VSENSPILNRIKKNLKALKSYVSQNNLTCYRVFDWDMPEYPLCIDFYEGKIHLAEYKTRHQLDDEQYQLWLDECIAAVKEIFNVDDTQIFFKKRENDIKALNTKK
jgi:23S rRNA (cytosine1962-C5)-methyltransferase